MQKNPPYKSIDLVDLFYKENVDLKPILSARKTKKIVSSGIEPYTGVWGKEQKKHLLNRTLMGYAQRHYKDLQNLSLDQAVDLIFTPDVKPDPPLNDYFNEITQEEIEQQGHIYVPPGEPYVEVGEPSGSPWARHQSLYAWIFKQNIEQKTSIHWKMVFFLHNLLATGRGSVKMQFQHMDMLFDSVYRGYKETIKALTLDPMMLDYLNLQGSQKDNPDENYARELQELFTVGKGPNSKFTEEDVVAAARVLVGWQYSWETKNKQGKIQTFFQSWNHDKGDKQFSAFYNNTIIKGKTGNEGATELDELLDMIFNTQECALYLCRRIYQFFVYPVLNDTVEANVITPLAELLRANNYDLMVPLKVLLKSEHFYDASFYNAMIKAPTEFVFGLMKEFEFDIRNYQNETDIPTKVTDAATADFYKYRPIDWNINNQGLNYMEPPSVSGWPAYYQAPVYDLFWINSYTISQRTQFGNSFGRWGFGLVSGDYEGWVHLVIDRVSYLMTFEEPEYIDKVIDEISDRLLGAPIQEKTKTRIKNEVLQGASEDYYTQLVRTYNNNPTEDNKNTLSNRIENLFGALFQLGEIHLF